MRVFFSEKEITMPYVPIKMSAPADNLVDASETVMLDVSGYLWNCGPGSGYAIGDGTITSKSSPVPVLCDRKYARLIDGGAYGALDESSYAWGWSGFVHIGVPIPGNFGQPQSVVGGIQWITLLGGGGKCGLDSKSYAWAWGGTNGVNGDNQNVTRSSPVSVVGDKQFTKIALGASSYILALDASSYLWAWGLNNAGQLGDNTILNRSSPVSVVGARQFVSVYTGYSTSYAMDSSSRIWSWGYNTYGLVGDGTILDRSSPISTSGPWDYFFADWYNVYARINNQWYVWGRNAAGYGNFGIGDTVGWTNSGSPASIAVNYPFRIKRFTSTGRAFDEDNNLWVWGNNASGVLGIGNTNNQSYPVRKLPRRSYGIYTPALTSFIKILNNQSVTSGEGISILLDQSSYAWTWGGGWISSIEGSSSPISVLGALRFLDLTVSKTKNIANDHCHIMGLDISSYAWAWGENTHGQLGDNSTTFISDSGGNFVATSYQNRSSPVSITGDKQWIKLLASHYHSMGLDISSYVWCWGDNIYGQLGNGSTILASSPTSVIGGRQAIDIAIGSTHSVLLDSLSYIWVWGSNTTGQLGLNDILNYSSPVSVVGDKQFIQITSNCAYNTWALDSSSYAWAWGINTNGILGINSIISNSSPVSVVGNRQFILISGSPLSCVALDSSSYAWTWGNNTYAQLGTNLNVASSSPVSVVGNYQWGTIDIGSCLIGATSYPNSNIVVCGFNNNNRYTNHFSESTYLSSPITVKFNHSYISPTTVMWKNILGK